MRIARSNTKTIKKLFTIEKKIIPSCLFDVIIVDVTHKHTQILLCVCVFLFEHIYTITYSHILISEWWMGRSQGARKQLSFPFEYVNFVAQMNLPNPRQRLEKRDENKMNMSGVVWGIHFQKWNNALERHTKFIIVIMIGENVIRTEYDTGTTHLECEKSQTSLMAQQWR